MTFASPSMVFGLMMRFRARSTHHKIALSALLNLRGSEAAAWRDLFLYEGDFYLKGAKAPDDVFRDSMNQVLHVRDNYWGGAPEAAESWYARLVERLKAKAWTDAAYAAGVLSHYWSDPIQPLHTGQTEAEGAVHRALEQSIAKSWDALVSRIGAAPAVEIPGQGPGWLGAMVRAGAEFASPYYDVCIDHYALERGLADPPAGLDDTLSDALARCIGHAVGGFATILSRAIEEAAVSPPQVNLTLQTAVEIIGIPVQAILKRIEDAEERAVLAEQFAEFQATGKVVRTLSHDDRLVRAAYANDILKIELDTLDRLPARPPGGAHGRPAGAAPIARPATRSAPPPIVPIADPVEVPAPVAASAPPPAPVAAATPPAPSPPADDDRLPLSAPVEDAPAIGPITAVRLADIGCLTVADLFALDPDEAAQKLAAKHIRADEIRRWQAAARLYRAIRTLNQTEAHLLAALGIETVEALGAEAAAPLASRIAAFTATSSGQRIARNASPPEVGEVETWIAAGRAAR